MSMICITWNMRHPWKWDRYGFDVKTREEVVIVWTGTPVVGLLTSVLEKRNTHRMLSISSFDSGIPLQCELLHGWFNNPNLLPKFLLCKWNSHASCQAIELGNTVSLNTCICLTCFKHHTSYNLKILKYCYFLFLFFFFYNLIELLSTKTSQK